jgi:23S rRNA pseudouridine2605 synthase
MKHDAASLVLMFHKPKGVVVTRRDERGRKTVYDLLPEWVREEGWAPVGRLDQDSRGLLLFVRDGRLVESLTRPGGFTRTYEVWVRGHVTAEHLARAIAGIPTALGMLRATRIEARGGAAHKTRLLVELDEGKNRHIRRIFGALRDPGRGTPLKVLELKRTGFGPLRLDIASGQWRFLTGTEATQLNEMRRTNPGRREPNA